MEDSHQPDLELARRILPAGLYKALVGIYQNNLKDCVLVGGTALSGFYAGHRRSDDLDFYTKDSGSFKATVLAAKLLVQHGIQILEQQSTASYFRAVCSSQEHSFTVDVVLDPNFFEVGRFHVLPDKIVVASLVSLLMCKAATLVSRASEKDLYDLIWLFERFPDLGLWQLIELGQKIDRGLSTESILLSLAGALLQENACGFSLSKNETKKQIYAKIQSFRKQLIKELTNPKNAQVPQGLAELVNRMKRK